MRESYRFNKRILTTESGTAVKSFEIVFMFAGTASALRGKNSFQRVQDSVNRIITLIAEREK